MSHNNSWLWQPLCSYVLYNRTQGTFSTLLDVHLVEEEAENVSTSSCSDSQPENVNYVKYPPTASAFYTYKVMLDLQQPNPEW